MENIGFSVSGSMCREWSQDISSYAVSILTIILLLIFCDLQNVATFKTK